MKSMLVSLVKPVRMVKVRRAGPIGCHRLEVQDPAEKAVCSRSSAMHRILTLKGQVLAVSCCTRDQVCDDLLCRPSLSISSSPFHSFCGLCGLRAISFLSLTI